MSSNRCAHSRHRLSKTICGLAPADRVADERSEATRSARCSTGLPRSASRWPTPHNLATEASAASLDLRRSNGWRTVPAEPTPGRVGTAAADQADRDKYDAQRRRSPRRIVSLIRNAFAKTTKTAVNDRKMRNMLPKYVIVALTVLP